MIGQDTRNGNRSKEETSLKLLESKCNADRKTLTKVVNNAVLPALEQLGIIPSGLRFAYPEQEDLDTLFTRTMQLLPHYEVDPQWVKNKFGIEITGARKNDANPQLHAQLNAQGDEDFFA